MRICCLFHIYVAYIIAEQVLSTHMNLKNLEYLLLKPNYKEYIIIETQKVRSVSACTNSDAIMGFFLVEQAVPAVFMVSNDMCHL